MSDNSIVVNAYSEKNLSVSSAKELWEKGVNSIFTDDPTKFNLI